VAHWSAGEYHKNHRYPDFDKPLGVQSLQAFPPSPNKLGYLISHERVASKWSTPLLPSSLPKLVRSVEKAASKVSLPAGQDVCCYNEPLQQTM